MESKKHKERQITLYNDKALFNNKDVRVTNMHASNNRAVTHIKINYRKY